MVHYVTWALHFLFHRVVSTRLEMGFGKFDNPDKSVSFKTLKIQTHVIQEQGHPASFLRVYYGTLNWSIFLKPHSFSYVSHVGVHLVLDMMGCDWYFSCYQHRLTNSAGDISGISDIQDTNRPRHSYLIRRNVLKSHAHVNRADTT